MRYIIVNSVKDGNRYIRKENRKPDNVTFNVACVHLLDLAKEVVIKDMARKGIIKAVDILQDISAVDCLLEIVKQKADDTYFVPRESVSPETCEEVFRVIQQIRMGATTPAYEQCKSASLEQLKDLIDSYENTLIQMDVYDIPLLYSKAISVLQEHKLVTSVKDSFEISDISSASCSSKLRDASKIANKSSHFDII